MSFVSGPITVRVPASSANLGPGFDTMGLALSLYDEVTVEHLPGPEGRLEIEIIGEGAGGLPKDETHLVIQSMRRAFKELGEEPPGLRVTCRNVIPHGRGLGSSAAAIVGGLSAARALTTGGGVRLNDRELLRLANEIEGHPDNVAAALLGGLTIAWTESGVGRAERLDARAQVTAFVPPVAVSTRTARGVLPETVPHVDAASNSGRAALLVAALSCGRDDLLFTATEDLLHQRYRAPAMPESYAFMSALRAEGIPAIISGAGPTVLAFATDQAERLPPGWKLLELHVDADGAAVVTR